MNLTAQYTLTNKITITDKLLFAKHLHTMVKSGIPLTESLGVLIEQSGSPAFKKVLTKVRTDVENGKELSEALKRHPKAFDQLFVGLVRVGEESGTLEESLGFLVIQLGKDNALRKKVKSALLYPAIVVFAIGIMGVFISLFVLPKLVDFFAAFDIELPLATKILLFVATLFRDYGYLIIGGTVGLVTTLYLLGRTRQFTPYKDRFVLALPVVGQLVRYGQLARFARNLGTLVKTGVPISTALTVTANSFTNTKYKADLKAIAASLEEGKTIGDSMKKYTLFPPLVARMIKIGEKTGKLDENLIYLSEFYEDEIDEMSKNLATVIEPVLLVVIGLVVGFVALAIISPIYELTGSIR